MVRRSVILREETFMVIQTYIEEDDIAIGVPIVTVNSVKSLRELDVAELFTELWIH